MYFFKHLEWRRTGFTNLINKGKGETMLKVKRKRKRKDETREKKHTNSIARIQQLLASRAWNFTTQPRKKNTRYVRSLNIMSRSITRPTVVLKETLLARFQMQISVKKKSDVNRSCKPSFVEKHFKAEESVTLQNILFLQWPTFVM